MNGGWKRVTNTELLRKVIKESGLKYGYIAGFLGLTRNGLLKKVNNKTEFKASEIQKLCILLKIQEAKVKEQIFFANFVDKKSTKDGD